jgi:cobalt-zinc-cadmium efflux system membrane fusion protein
MKYIFFYIASATLLTACGDKVTEKAVTQETEAIETVKLYLEQMQRADIQIGQAEQRNISATLIANGVVSVLPENKATVTSKINGRIEAFFIHEGQYVKKGQALMSVGANQLFDIQQDYLQAKADLIFLEKELERQKTLSNQQVGSNKNYEEAQSKFAHATADLQTAAAKLQYLGIDLNSLNQPQPQLAKSILITAPISGNISGIPVNIGASVGDGTVLCNIVGLDDLHAHVEVFAKDIALVKQGQKVTIRFPNTQNASIEADIEYISYEMDPNSKTYSLHIHLPAPKGNTFLPGMPVVAEIQTESNLKCLALPEAAVLREGAAYYCFVANPPVDGQVVFQKLAFEPSRQGGGWIGLPEGLLVGKSVVIQGANRVNGEMKKGEMAE